MKYYLAGDFNGWRCDDPAFQFIEATDPYGGLRPEMDLSLGAHFLETHLPEGIVRFKVVQNGSWAHQWTIHEGALSQDIQGEGNFFRMRHGLHGSHLVYRGGGELPHCELYHGGGPLRWDFHPKSQTLTVHCETNRISAPKVQKSYTLRLGGKALLDSWCCLPYGYRADEAFRYPLCVLFDGRNLLYGEDASHGIWNQPRRQWARALDVLTRHGVIAPTILLAVGLPRWDDEDDAMDEDALREDAYGNVRGYRHRCVAKAITGRDLWQDAQSGEPEGQSMDNRRDFIGLAQRVNRATEHPREIYLVGHGRGADMAMKLLGQAPDLFGGVVAVSPCNADGIGDVLSKISGRKGEGPRISLSYAADELAPIILTGAARSRIALAEAGVSHLVNYCPTANYDPDSVFDMLPGLFAHVLG